jgi:hypothetical protein
MNASYSKTYVIGNDDTGTAFGSFACESDVTFYPTTITEAEVKDQFEEAAEEINRLEDMMHERSDHKDNKRLMQHKENGRAKRSSFKHKKPHMNRRIIR